MRDARARHARTCSWRKAIVGGAGDLALPGEPVVAIGVVRDSAVLTIEFVARDSSEGCS
jgi:hypothetical protein